MILARKIASDQNKPPETMGRLLGKSNGNLAGQKKVFAFFFGTLNFMIVLQSSLLGSCLRPDKSIPHTFTLHNPCVLSFYRFMILPSYLFSSEFSTKKKI
jgi:hypothetical protein